MLVAGGLAFTGCSAGSRRHGGGASGKVLTVGMPNGPQQPNQNPLATGSASLSLGYAFVVYESLMQVNDVDPTADPTPWLADSVEWNADSTQAIITARDGVKWNDGEDFTADDIAFSIQLRKDNPELNADFPDQYGDITVDGNQVTVNFTTGQYVNQVKLYQLLIVPQHIWDGEDAVTFSDDDMVGTGPFMLKTFSPQAVTLTPNDDYWGGKSKVAELRYDAFNDNAGLTTALTTGEAQWGWTFIPDYETTFIAKDPEHFNQVAGGGFGVDVLYLNNETKPFDDVAFRTALSMVVDHADITKTAGYGVWPEITSVTGMPQPSGDAFISDEFQGAGTRGRRRRRQAGARGRRLHVDRRAARRPRRRERLVQAHEPERLDRLPRRARHHRRGCRRARRRGHGRRDRAGHVVQRHHPVRQLPGVAALDRRRLDPVEHVLEHHGRRLLRAARRDRELELRPLPERRGDRRRSRRSSRPPPTTSARPRSTSCSSTTSTTRPAS